MKRIYVALLSVFFSSFNFSTHAQQLVAAAGQDSFKASWAIGEVIGGCFQTEDCFIVQGILSYADMGLTVGIEDNEERQKANIWPNPVIDYLNVFIPEYYNSVQISIYSLVGTMVKQFQLSESKATYSLSSLSPGLYTMELTTIDGKIIENKKIIKL